MILIKRVQIIDGSGKPPFLADVLLQGDKISAIGNFPNKSADLEIDGLGFYLTPGFIDVDTDSDHYLSLFDNPSQKDFLLQGVTTIIGGNCGASLAPLIYGSLESISKWTNINKINVDWRTVAEFLKVLNRFKIGVNFGTLIGHTTIRRALVGDDLRELTPAELAVFKRVIRESLEEGALGLSTGLGYAHGRQTPYIEIKELAGVVKELNGVYATHLRDERDGLTASVNETIQIVRETGVKTLISHFRSLIGFEKYFEEGLSSIESAGDLDINFDVYPFDVSITPIYTLLPAWAQNGGFDTMLANLNDPSLRSKIIREFPHFEENDVTIAYSQALERVYLIGKTIGAIAKDQNVGIQEALAKIMTSTNLKTIVIYKNINSELSRKAMVSPRAFIASNASSLAESEQIVKHERFFNTFPKFLEIVERSKILTLEDAIQKITSLPAKKFGFKNRGLIKDGYAADLVLLKDSKIHFVFVNGQPVVKDGRFQNVFAGKILKKE